MLERDVVAAIKKYLASLGSDVFFWKEHGGPYGTSGVPDIICCYKGRFLGLEVKLPTGTLTELQKRAIDRINRAGGMPETPQLVGTTVVIVSEGGKVNIRAGNGTQYARLSSVAPGTTFEYIATAENGWYAVPFGNRVGWVSGSYAKLI